MVTYPMLSECYGWTSRREALGQKVKIPMQPGKMPEGREDMTKLFIGNLKKQHSKDGLYGEICIFVWREEKKVFISNA